MWDIAYLISPFTRLGRFLIISFITLFIKVTLKGLILLRILIVFRIYKV